MFLRPLDAMEAKITHRRRAVSRQKVTSELPELSLQHYAGHGVRNYGEPGGSTQCPGGDLHDQRMFALFSFAGHGTSIA